MEPESLDLIVERYQFKADSADTKRDALLSAARLAERVLYIDIAGALQLDLIIGWGKQSPNYPVPEEHSDGVAKWRPQWHIPPYEYESSIRWRPYDGMQQFDIGIESKEEENIHTGKVNMVAYVWDDKPLIIGDGRKGCLLDVVNRNRDRIIFAESGRIAIPMDKNTKTDINHAHLDKYGDRWHIFGFEFPPDDRGDRSHRPVVFTAIDIEERHQDCGYRDR